MTDVILQLFAAFVACFFFSIIYHAKPKRLVFCGLSGVIGWAVYLLFDALGFDLFISYMLGAAAVTLYSELMARFQKTPSAIYLIPGLLPMVPGGSLYYTTQALVAKNNAEFKLYSQNTIVIALSIAVGMIAVVLIFYYFNRHSKNRIIGHGAQ